MEEIFLVIIVFIFGIVIGSFLNVLIYRIPKGENIAYPASKCQSCQTSLKWWHNIPIISWIILGGRCYFCKEKISMQYPLIEFATGMMAVILFLKLGIVWYLPILFIVFVLLFALVMIDFKYMAVPDSLNLLALALAVINPHAIDSLQYALMASGGLALISYYVGYFKGVESMGEGDVIVAGTMGAVLGFPLFFYALFLSSILGLIAFATYAKRDQPIPFVPFLAIATFIVYIADKQFMQLANWIMYG